MPAETTENTDQLTPEQMWQQELASRREDPAPANTAAVEDPAPGNAADAAALEASAVGEAAKEQPKGEPSIEERLAAMEVQNRELTTQLNRQNGRVSALQTKLDSGAAAAKAAGAGNSPTKEQQAAAIEDPEEWKQLMEDFPEWGTAVMKKMEAELSRRLAAVKAEQPAGADQAAVATIVEQQIAERETARIDRLHPGWREEVNKPSFVEWFKKQPAEVQALAESPYSDDVDHVLKTYKASLVPSKASAIVQRRQGALEVAAVDGKPQQKAPPGSKSEEDMSPQELWALEKRRRAQKRAA